MKVLSKQLSGLGNQLFQYAAGLYCADKYHGALEIIEEPHEGRLSHGQYARPFLLPKFSLSARILTKTRFDHRMLAQGPRSMRWSAPIKFLGGIAIRHEAKEQRYRFSPETFAIPRATRVLYLSGYWQVHQYAAAVADQLRREFRLREPATGGNRAMLDRIEAEPTPVSLHMRRGDYTLAAEGNIVLPLDYYHRAIAHIRERFANPVFFVFSDDIAYAREVLPTDIRSVFVEGNDDFSSQEDLRLMSACHHHIIANSSFSWWGAWLNGRPDKVVVAPKHWLLSQESFYPDLFPPEWIPLDSMRQT